VLLDYVVGFEPLYTFNKYIITVGTALYLAVNLLGYLVLLITNLTLLLVTPKRFKTSEVKLNVTPNLGTKQGAKLALNVKVHVQTSRLNFNNKQVNPKTKIFKEIFNSTIQRSLNLQCLSTLEGSSPSIQTRTSSFSNGKNTKTPLLQTTHQTEQYSKFVTCGTS